MGTDDWPGPMDFIEVPGTDTHDRIVSMRVEGDSIVVTLDDGSEIAVTDIPHA